MLKLQRGIFFGLFFFFLSLCVYTPGLSIHGLEYRDDEIFYYKSTQEMLARQDLLSPTYFGEDRFQKPILFYWLVLLSYKMFGINWFAARLVSVVLAALTVVLTWKMARTLFDEQTAHLSAVILMTTSLFFRHAKNVVPDMALNFFIVLAMYLAVRIIQGRARQTDNLWFFTGCALGFMVKGFAAVLFPIGTVVVFALMTMQKGVLGRFRFGRGMIILLLIVLPWFIYMAVTHGSGYLEYMLVDETTNRVWDANSETALPAKLMNFFEHFGFYLYVMFVYFAPWSVFGLGALPLALARRKDPGLRFLLIWFFLVLIVFSFLFFRIAHYMLVLTTPFAILTSYFLLAEIRNGSRLDRIKQRVQKGVCLLVLLIGMAAFGFLLIFLAGYSMWWSLVLVTAAVVLSVVVIKGGRKVIAPVIMGSFLLFVLSQTSLMAQAGVTPHATLQKFAATIHEDKKAEAAIGVASHDIHEKEFQVYFDEKVVQGGHTHEGAMKYYLTQLFNTDKVVYCLVIDKDLNFLKELGFGPFEVLREEYIVRRRMDLDWGFVKALLNGDRETIQKYLKEKVILLKRDSHV